MIRLGVGCHCFGVARFGLHTVQRRCCVTSWSHCANNSHQGSGSLVASSPFGAGPRILFLGGDEVSCVALEALHQNLVAFSKQHGSCGFQLRVVCPAIPHSFRVEESPSNTTTLASNNTTHRIQRCDNQRLRDVVLGHKHHFPVARYCIQNNVPFVAVDHPTSLTKSSVTAASVRIAPDVPYDVAVVVSFRYFLPGAFLDALPPTINMHPSLLPKYRGASPIYATMRSGEAVGGYSVIKIVKQETMDCGDILLQESIPIPEDMDMRQYFPAVTSLGASGLCRVLFGKDLRHCKGNDCGPLFSSRSAWRDAFQGAWEHAVVQPNKPARLGEDPFHAPLLGKSAASLPFGTKDGADVHNCWRAFAAGHHRLHPHAVLDKATTPSGVQQLQREERKLLRGHGGAKETCSGSVVDRLKVHFVVSGAVHPNLVALPVYEELKAVERIWTTSMGASPPAGSAVFPTSDHSLCAVRCLEGWFFWTSGVLHNSTQQPAKSLRQGMAMKCGVLYPKLFVC